MENMISLSVKMTLLVFVFLLSCIPGSSQTQLGNDIDGEVASDISGYSVSLSSDGNTVAIGAPFNDGNGAGNGANAGHVRIYKWNGTAWGQQGNDIDGEADFDQSGWFVSLSSDGSMVAIGAPTNKGNQTGSGHVRIYRWNGSTWAQQGGDINGEAGNDRSGHSVSLSSDGSAVAIGAIGNDGNGANSGHVRIYRWNGSSWAQQGSDLNGEAASDQSGYSVSLSSDGSIVAIGARSNDGNGSNSGHVRIYAWNGSSWAQQGSDIDGEAASDQSGTSVSLSSDGTTVAIGATGNDGNGANSGHVRIYRWNGTSWTQRGADIDGEAAGDRSGISVSLNSDGTTVAIGASGNEGNGGFTGHVRIYTWNGTSWTQHGADIDGEAAIDNFGLSVSLSSDGSKVAIGAPGNDGNGFDAGHVRVYQLSSPCSEITLSFLPLSFGDYNISTQGGSNGWIKTLVEGGTAPYTYSWTGPSNATGANPTGLKAGVYFLHVVDNNGCEGIGGPWNLVDP